LKVRGSFLVKFLKNLTALVLGLFVIYFGCVVVLTLIYRWIDPPVTALMVLRRLEGISVTPARSLPYERIPAYAKKTIVYLEDHEFWSHHGVIFGAIREAWEANQKARRVERGGSTITQQLARNLFLFPDRMYLRKALEAGTAIILELLLTKQRILELYLNHIEWGPGVFGIEAGARYQFGTGVRNLNREQLSRLEAIITNPVTYTVKTFPRNRGMEARYEALMDW
jgi:monofunctional glycosyltransferase